MELRRKAKAIAAIPNHLQTMTMLVIAAVVISIIAMITSIASIGAVRHAN